MNGRHDHTTAVLRLFTMVRRSSYGSDWLLDLGTDFFGGNMVFDIFHVIRNMNKHTGTVSGNC